MDESRVSEIEGGPVGEDVFLSFRKTVSLVEIGPEALALERAAGRFPLTHLSPGVRDAWRVLASTGATESAIATRVAAADDALGFLQYSVPGHRLDLTVVPMMAGFYVSSVAVEPTTPLRLSRFAYCRRLDDTLILESPLATSRAILRRESGASLMAMLASPRTCDQRCAVLDAAGSASPVDRGAVRSCLSLLAAAGFLAAANILLQTMYLVATAMGLAPCALGGGNSAVFAAAAGTNEFEESSVGEFILGSRETP